MIREFFQCGVNKVYIIKSNTLISTSVKPSGPYQLLSVKLLLMIKSHSLIDGVCVCLLESDFSSLKSHDFRKFSAVVLKLTLQVIGWKTDTHSHLGCVCVTQNSSQRTTGQQVTHMTHI